jgi:NAD(P)-dependent dehydrogenase (short-subunit alcohol dehydrogenase family)
MQRARYALVTGGNRGIGLEVCQKLVSRGKPCILTARSLDAARTAAEQLRQTSGGVDVHVGMGWWREWGWARGVGGCCGQDAMGDAMGDAGRQAGVRGV